MVQKPIQENYTESQMRFAEVEVTQMTFVPLNFNLGQSQTRKAVYIYPGTLPKQGK